MKFLFSGQLNNHAEKVQHLCFNKPKFLFIKFCPVSYGCFVMCTTTVNPDCCQVLLCIVYGTYQSRSI